MALFLATLLVAALAAIPVGLPAQATATATEASGVTDLSAAGQNAYYPQVAVDADGIVTAVWQRFNGAHSVVQATSRSPGGRWSTPVDVSTPGQDADSQRVAAAGGTAAVVWQRFDGAHYTVQGTMRSTGGTWTTPADLSSPSSYPRSPQVAVAADGTTTAVWHDYDGTNSSAMAATRSPGGAWTAPIEVSTLMDAYASSPQVASAPAGTTSVVWHQHSEAGWIVQAAVRSPGGAWTAPTDLSTPSRYAQSPQVAVAADGTAIAIWAQYVESNTVVQTATHIPGGAWTTPTDHHAVGLAHYSPHLAVAADGSATAVWTRSDGLYAETVQAVNREPGGVWTAPTDLSDPAGKAWYPRVAAAHGTATAVWTRWNGSNFVLRAATRGPSDSWTRLTDLSAPGQDAWFPQVAVASDGTTTAVWVRFDGSNWIIQGRVIDHDSPALDIVRIPDTGRIDQLLLFEAIAVDLSNPTTLTWTLGDGTTRAGTSVTHAYTSVGTYTVGVTATDALGNATTRTAGTVTITRPVPQITRFKLTRTTISTSHRPRATRAVITLTDPAKIVLTFKKKGTRAKRTAFRLDAGTTRVRLTARLSRTTRLMPGTYKVTAATNKAGASTPRTTRLRVVR